MFKRVFPAVVLTFLLGCGGGGGGGTTSAVQSPRLIESRSAIFPIVYNGSEEQAELSFESAGPFFRYIVANEATAAVVPSTVHTRSLRIQTGTEGGPIIKRFTRVASKGTENLRAKQTTYRSVALNDAEQCQFGGQVLTKGTLSDDGTTGEFVVSFLDCFEGDEKTTGDMAVSFFAGASELRMDFSIEQMVILGTSTQVSLQGTATVLEADGCLSRLTESSLSRDDVTGRVVRTEGFTQEDSTCSGSYPSLATMYTGRVFHSDWGYVDINTPQQLKLNFSRGLGVFPITDGILSLAGAGGAAMSLIVDDGVDGLTRRNPALYARIDLDAGGDGNVEQVGRFDLPAVQRGAIFDMADDDRDGMINEWERVYGFDYSDPNDAEMDADGDGFSNGAEAEFRSDPRNATKIPVAVELAVNATELSSVMPVPAGEETTIDFGYTGSSNYGSEPEWNLRFSVRKSANVTWSALTLELGDCAASETDPDQLVCSGEADWVSIVVPRAAGEEYWLTVQATSEMFESNLTNNTSTVRNTTGIRSVDTYVTSGANAAVVSAVAAGRIKVGNNDYGMKSLETVLNLELPDGVEFIGLETASRSSPPSAPIACSEAQKITCSLGAIDFIGVTYIVSLRATEVGMHQIGVGVGALGMDPDTSNNEAILTFPVGVDSGVVQAQVDAAADNAEVVIPGGLYVGEVNLAGKPITLRGASLETKVSGQVKMSSGSKVAGITFLAGSNGGVTVVSGSQVEGNHFEEGTGVQSDLIEASEPGIKDVLINRNTFMVSETAAIHITAASATIENNVFAALSLYGGGADGIFLEYRPDPNAASNMVAVRNNSFYRTLAGVNIFAVTGDAASFDVKNNIFMLNGVGISVRNLGVLSTVSVTNSLYFGTSRRTEGAVNSINDINVDPQFVDAANGDFHLSPTSPAIDSGSALDAPAVDFAGSIRPVDGNGDGTVEVDIGAYEFQP